MKYFVKRIERIHRLDNKFFSKCRMESLDPTINWIILSAILS